MKSVFGCLLLVLSVTTAWAAGDVVEDKELAQALYDSTLTQCDRLGVTPQRLENLLRLLKAEIRSQVLAGKEVRLAHFGTFFKEHVLADTVADLPNGEVKEIPARDVVGFKAHDPSIRLGKSLAAVR